MSAGRAALGSPSPKESRGCYQRSDERFNEMVNELSDLGRVGCSSKNNERKEPFVWSIHPSYPLPTETGNSGAGTR